MPDGALFAQQADQADPAQDVVTVSAERHDEIIDGKFAGRQALDVQVGFELAMKLFGGGESTFQRIVEFVLAMLLARPSA